MTLWLGEGKESKEGGLGVHLAIGTLVLDIEIKGWGALQIQWTDQWTDDGWAICFSMHALASNS